MGLVGAGFLAFLLFTSNPFDRLLPPAADGRDLNPLLQDPGMVLHPPMLYMGYVGFSVAFAFAVAALLSGRLDATWARWSRPWTTVAWAFLTVGIALGSGWAYYELGWGGWWFWDPAENASFMPWLVGTALIHSLPVTENPGAFRRWTGLPALRAPYFEAVFVPLMAPALFLMGVGPLARWKRTSLPELAVLLRWALGVSLALGLALPFAFGRWSALVGFGLALAVWVASTAFLAWKKRPTHSRAHLGMVVAHLGVAVFVVGVTLVKGYEAEKDLKMKPGDSLELAGYAFLLEDVSAADGPNYRAARARIAVSREGKPVTVLYPEKRVYTVQDIPMTEAAIDPGLTRDLYVSLGDPLEGGYWLVKVQHKPFVDWIWAGCLIMALGGLLAASDRRYRVAARERRGAEATA